MSDFPDYPDYSDYSDLDLAQFFEFEATDLSNLNPKLAANLAVCEALDAYALGLYEKAKARAEALKAK